jgi:hypothetical protein
VRPDRVVLPPPVAEHHPGVTQGGEQNLVDALIAQPAVEALAEGVLLRLALGDVMPGDTMLLSPVPGFPAYHGGNRGAVSDRMPRPPTY